MFDDTKRLTKDEVEAVESLRRLLWHVTAQREKVPGQMRDAFEKLWLLPEGYNPYLGQLLDTACALHFSQMDVKRLKNELRPGDGYDSGSMTQAFRKYRNERIRLAIGSH